MNFQKFKKKYEKISVNHYPHNVDDNPIVSVCVQTYNHAYYIKECLDGILMQQTDFPIEILLGEDASKDGTREICLEYAQKYPDKIRLFLHHRENNIKFDGQSTGRFNFLYNLYNARGKYIALCEGDDYWTNPLKLQKQVEILESNSEYAMSSHKISFDYDNVNIERNYYGKPIADSNFEQILFSKFFIALNSLVFRIQYIEDLPNWFLKLNGAHKALVYYISSKGKNYHFMDKMGVKRRNPGGVTIKYKEERKRTKLKRQVFLLENLKTSVDSEKKILIDKKIKSIYLQHIKKAIRKGKVLKGSQLLLKYLKRTFQ